MSSFWLLNFYRSVVFSTGKVDLVYFQVKGAEKDELEECEKLLDVTSIVIIRQQMELELQRVLKTEAKQDKGWFGWMWKGGGTQDDDKSKSADLCEYYLGIGLICYVLT